MTHWQLYNTFERLIFLIGYFAIWYVIVKLLAKALDAWDKRHAKKAAMKQKTHGNVVRMPAGRVYKKNGEWYVQ